MIVLFCDLLLMYKYLLFMLCFWGVLRKNLWVVGYVRGKGEGEGEGGHGFLGWSEVRECVGEGCEVSIRFGLGGFIGLIVFFREWGYNDGSLEVYDSHIGNYVYLFL